MEPETITEVIPDLSVESLLADFAAPATFDIALPNGAVLKCRGFGSYAEKKAFEREQSAFVKDQMKAKVAAIKGNDHDLLSPPYRPYFDLINEDNLVAAFTIHRVCVAPALSPIDALRLCAAPQLIAYFMDQWTWNASNFLLKLKNDLYNDAKKD